MLSNKLCALTTAYVHISWQLAALSLGILLGISSTLLFPTGLFTSTWWLLVVFGLFGLVIKNHTGWALIIAIMSGVVFGLWLGSHQEQQLTIYESYYDKTVVMTGSVIDDTDINHESLYIQLGNITIQSQELEGTVWISTPAKADIKRGDILTVKGKLKEGFGNFPAAMYRGKIIDASRPYPGDIGRRARDTFASYIRSSIPEPESQLGVSFLTGHQEIVPEEISNRLRILGLVHIVVASGFHLTIVVRAARRAFANLSKYLATFSGMIMIVAFLLITGFSTSMTRASLVAGLSLLAWYYGRNIHPVVLLLLVAAATASLDPTLVWGDMGWYLSFAAFGGVIILAPLLNRYFFGDNLQNAGTLRHIIFATTAAQITTLPIIALAFEHYSLLALVANLLILPLLPLAMLLTFTAGLVAIVSAQVATITGLPAYGLLLYITHITDWLAQTPWASGDIALTPVHATISYMFILGVIVYLRYVTGHQLKQDNAIA